MRFSANISLLFGEVEFIDRFERAAQAGMSAVEFWWPGEEHLADIPAAVAGAGVEVALFNLDAGDMPAGDRGILSDPARVDAFRESVPAALALAERIGCTAVNALVGLELAGMDRDEQLALAVDSLRWVADRAADHGISVMVEPVNDFENGPYLVTRTGPALEIIERTERENVLLQYDAYHMQRMEGNLVATLHEHIDRIGHVQIADSPGRGEPGTGEINYDFVLRQLRDLGYLGYVGLEYKPTTSTLESLEACRALLALGDPQPGGGGR